IKTLVEYFPYWTVANLFGIEEDNGINFEPIEYIRSIRCYEQPFYGRHMIQTGRAQKFSVRLVSNQLITGKLKHSILLLKPTSKAFCKTPFGLTK
uniref:Uncharacterized protein n=1 Tax=Romanomermis culicivorax TaxID=13658 RepID=A0A915IZQ7_ROMCU